MKTPVHFFYRYHLKDVIVGKIYFLLVRIKIQHMELQLIKKEITGIGKKNKIRKRWQLGCQLSLVQTWRMKSAVAALAELVLSVLVSHRCLTTTCISCILYLTPEQCLRPYECWASSTDLNHCKWSSCRNTEELKQSLFDNEQRKKNKMHLEDCFVSAEISWWHEISLLL